MSIILKPNVRSAAKGRPVISEVRRELSAYALTGEDVTKQAILDFAKENNVRYVNMQFTDMLGIVKNVTVPVHKLSEA
ncbi:glutamine synthetase, partial [Patescibacteria group bacterium]|nr:glutamine synthetase [Patescibacteria group bacterium]